MPVQRIPRYQLLLQDLQKNTWPEHPDSADLSEAVLETEKACRYVNDAKRDLELREGAWALKERCLPGKLKLDPDFFSTNIQNRKLIVESELDVQLEPTVYVHGAEKDPDVKMERRICLLLTDCILICRPKDEKKEKAAPDPLAYLGEQMATTKLRVDAMYDIEKLQVANTAAARHQRRASAASLEFTIMQTLTGHQTRMRALDESTVEKWLTSLSQLIENDRKLRSRAQGKMKAADAAAVLAQLESEGSKSAGGSPTGTRRGRSSSLVGSKSPVMGDRSPRKAVKPQAVSPRKRSGSVTMEKPAKD
jgi:RhoGEF domain